MEEPVVGGGRCAVGLLGVAKKEEEAGHVRSGGDVVGACAMSVWVSARGGRGAETHAEYGKRGSSNSHATTTTRRCGDRSYVVQPQDGLIEDRAELGSDGG